MIVLINPSIYFCLLYQLDTGGHIHTACTSHTPIVKETYSIDSIKTQLSYGVFTIYASIS